MREFRATAMATDLSRLKRVWTEVTARGKELFHHPEPPTQGTWPPGYAAMLGITPGQPMVEDPARDLLIVAREGFGTRNAIPSTPKARNTKVFPIYAAETIPLERDDVTEVRVTTNTPKRTWSQSINRAFLVSAEEATPTGATLEM